MREQKAETLQHTDEITFIGRALKKKNLGWEVSINIF